MNCRDFEERLDAGLPPDAESRRHAERCAGCAAMAEAQDRLEAVLRQRFAVAPEGFTQRVLSRVAEVAPEQRTRDHAVPPAEDGVWPWWLQILTEPSAVLGLTLGGLYALFAPRLFGLSSGALPFLEHLLSPWVGRIGAGLGQLPSLQVAVLAAIFVVGATYALFQGSDALFARLARTDRR